MDRLNRAARAILGAVPLRRTALHGGDMSEVVLLTLPDGRQAVAKSGPLVGREARMLMAIRDAGAPAPAVLGLHGDVLLLEALAETSPSPAGWTALGRGLRRLHDTTGPSYGWDEDYAFGAVAIANATAATWPAFWADRRLLVFQPGLPVDLARRIEALASRLDGLLPRNPRPALLHGDLWTGNALFSGDRAYLIDPACYFGDPAVDLAMLALFGRPGAGFHDGYGAVEPSERQAVYQLWPALVHLRLFGPGYRGLAERCLEAVGA